MVRDRCGDELPGVDDCDLCDGLGYRKPRQGPNDSCAPGVVCDHFDYAAAALRGMALIRQTLQDKQQRKEQNSSE
jgi:hypothetical protein